MGKVRNTARILNIITYLVIISFIIVIAVKAAASGYPWSLSCYLCKKCASSCILGIDPSQLLLAAHQNNPNLYITANNIRLKSQDACRIDKDMKVLINNDIISVSQALKNKIFNSNDYITSYSMKAKDAARFCIKCRACSRDCPFTLPILDAVDELNKDNNK